jgi:hypothetical protein
MDIDDLITLKDSFIVVLDSRNATQYLNGTYNSNVRFIFEEGMYFPHNNIQITCCVLNFICPNSIYIINETNNLLSLTINNIATNYYITYGNYNATNFMTYLLSVLPSGFTISLNSITNIFTMTYTSNFTINSTSTIYNIMGFLNNTNYTSSSFSLTFPFTCNFNGIQSLNISLKNINTNNLDSYNKTQTYIIQTVNVDTNKTIIEFNKSEDYGITIKQNAMEFIDIGLTDNLQNFINLNNQHWNITLLFNIVSDKNRFAYQNSFLNILRNGKSIINY